MHSWIMAVEKLEFKNGSECRAVLDLYTVLDLVYSNNPNQWLGLKHTWALNQQCGPHPIQ